LANSDRRRGGRLPRIDGRLDSLPDKLLDKLIAGLFGGGAHRRLRRMAGLGRR
jgi:hypothetical protein